MTTDHLGSPRVITDQNGSVTNRKDYTAFGEENFTAERVGSLGYSTADDIRKGYTGYEKDDESGLDFAQARYYNLVHGRYTSVDPLTASASIRNPQTFNRYTYVLNSPYKFTDPLGLIPVTTGACGTWCPNVYAEGVDNGGGRPGYNDPSKNFLQQQAETADPPPNQKQIPTSLEVLSVTVIDPKDVPEGYVSPNSNAQIFVKITYRVLDKNGKPIKNPNLVPLESIGISSNRVTDQGAQQDAEITKEDKEDKSEVGGERSGTPRTTDSSGQFVDAPVGISADTSSLGQPMTSPNTGQNFGRITEINFIMNQTLYIKQGSDIYEVRSNKFTISFRSNSISLTNGSDISACRGAGCK